MGWDSEGDLHYIRCHYVPFKGKHNDKDIKTERPAGAANAAEGAAVAAEGVTDLLGRQQGSNVGNGVREEVRL